MSNTPSMTVESIVAASTDRKALPYVVWHSAGRSQNAGLVALRRDG